MWLSFLAFPNEFSLKKSQLEFKNLKIKELAFDNFNVYFQRVCIAKANNILKI